MCVDRIGVVGDRASKGHAARMYGVGFTAGFLARVGARSWMRGEEGRGTKLVPSSLCQN